VGTRIFMAEDFTLKGNVTYLIAVVKSSNIIVGTFVNMPSVSLVYPNIKVLPAVRTGVLYESSYSVDLTI
jgi:hypothetical protein